MAYHIAWAIDDLRGDRCAHIVTHSMAGLIARYALQMVEAGHPDFPPDLCVRTAFTFGTPHLGSAWAWGCAEQQCRQIRIGSDFLHDLAAAGGAPRAGPTTWYVAGSNTDGIVPAPSQLAAGDIRMWYDAGLLNPEDALVHTFYYENTEARRTPAQVDHGAGPLWREVPFPVRLVDEVASGRLGVVDGPLPRGLPGHPGLSSPDPEPDGGPWQAPQELGVSCGRDPDLDGVFAVWRHDGNVTWIERSLPATTSTWHADRPGTWQVTCQDAFTGSSVSWDLA